jgi:3-oxoacyl-[acyl-carrier protein] reductase
MKQLNLTGKTAVVTGGAGQIGRTLCRALADCGANVAVCYHSNADYARKVQQDLEKQYGVKAVAVQADVADKNSVAAMKKAVNDALGAVDIIVNNAVHNGDEWKSVLEENGESYERQFRTCTMHAVFMAQAFAPDMIKRQYGRIIGINTECAMQMFPYQSAYVSGKRGMDGVYKILAREVGRHNVTVNQVAPGWTITDSDRHPDPALANTKQDFPYVSTVPMGRRGSDEEIANAVCFLASDLASFITGLYMPVCGGNVMPSI